MAIECDPGQWFIDGTMAAFNGPTPYGWVEKIDPLSLEPIACWPSPTARQGPSIPIGAYLPECLISVVRKSPLAFPIPLGPNFLNVPEQFGGGGRIRTGDRGFAGPCLTTWLRRHPTTRCRGLGFDVASKL